MNPTKLSDSDILDMYNSGAIKFIDRYEEKFKIKYKI